MKYPSIEKIKNADHIQLAKWCRFLPSPGALDIGCDNDTFTKILESETRALELIIKRFNEFGGMTCTVSKKIGLKR